MSIYESADAAANHATNAELSAWSAASLAETAGDQTSADAARHAATAMGVAADIMRKFAEGVAVSRPHLSTSEK